MDIKERLEIKLRGILDNIKSWDDDCVAKNFCPDEFGMYHAECDWYEDCKDCWHRALVNDEN